MRRREVLRTTVVETTHSLYIGLYANQQTAQAPLHWIEVKIGIGEGGRFCGRLHWRERWGGSSEAVGSRSLK